MNNDTFSSEIINSEDVFSDLEQQRQSGALTRAIREANAPQPVYGIDHERYGDQVMAYYPDGTVRPSAIQTTNEKGQAS